MNEESINDLLGPEGPLSQHLPRFEERPSQQEMAVAVERTLLEGGRLIAEAGPGTGKTFAYLLPALRLAEVPNQRIVISTWTRNLQDQIERKDLPVLREAFGLQTTLAVMQGRENYVCRRRAHENLEGWGVFGGNDPLAQEARVLLDWADRSPQGVRSRLGFEPKPELWAAVRAERGNCLQSQSPFFRQCAWQWGKRRARDAEVLIVNHALLLSDLNLRRIGGSVLPAYSRLIIDEAHHLEEVAADHLGARLSRPGVFAVISRAGSPLDGLAADVTALAARCRSIAADLFDEAEEWLGRRAHAPLEPGDFITELAPTLRELQAALVRSARGAKAESMATELEFRAQQCSVLSQETLQVLERPDPDYISFATQGEREGWGPTLRSSPIETGPILAKELFGPLEASVLTSATLTVPGREDAFDYIRRSTGLADAQVQSLPSPFDYENQAVIVVDPLPNPSQESAWNEALAERVPAHVRRCHGRAFVLFTSRRTMETVAEATRDAIEFDGIELLVQGRRTGRADLLKRFRDAQPAVLFGLASFWEGVDVAGSSLSHVILTRLPFRVPGHPRDEERGRRLRAQGLEPFRDLSLPEAVLRWKQGFGRLIRSRDDTGFVTILDSRVLTKAYGRTFLQALPPCPRVVLRDGEEIPLFSVDDA